MAILANVKADLGSLVPSERNKAIIDVVEGLDSQEKRDLIKALGGPTQGVTDKIWMIVVIAFVIVFIGAFLSMAYYYKESNVNLDKLLTVFTTVSAFLAGLLAPSLVANRQ
jgi:hypothetical protein